MIPKSINRWWIDWISNQPRTLNPSPNIGWLKFLSTPPLKATSCKFALVLNSRGGQQTRSSSFDGYHRPIALSLQFIVAVDVHSKLAGQPTRPAASLIHSFLWESDFKFVNSFSRYNKNNPEKYNGKVSFRTWHPDSHPFLFWGTRLY